jgi:abortive infection bacteriophage resistance protein
VEEVNREFCKPPLTVQQQIELLSERGLDIPEIPKAEEYLKFIGYYRLSAYFIPFQKGGASQDLHLFETGATFDRVLDLYIFDRKLRLLVMDAIERIEVAIKAAIALNLSVKYGSHWFMDKDLFSPGFSHTEFLDQVKKDINFDRPKNQEKFIQHYYQKYSKPELPP